MELIGQRFGHIRVTEVVGQGGMGDVYAGYDEKLERKVALKVLNADQRLDREGRERLLREARALSRIDHPNICRIHDYIESDDVDLLVLEYIDGQTLSDAIQERMPRGEKLRIACAVAGVLVAAHRAGIVHRDLKPENVMLTRDGDVKVLDFGLARWLNRARRSSDRHHAAAGQVVPIMQGRSDSTMILPAEYDTAAPVATAVGVTLGTPLYMSPEQARGETLTPASDMFSFGLLLQALFTGEDPHPLGLSAREIILRAARGETNAVHDVPGDIASLIGRLKQFAPPDRPTAVETLARLRFLTEKPQRILRRAIVAALIVIASIGVWRYTVDLQRERASAIAARAEAERRRAQAEDLINFMVVDLRKKLEPVGQLPILDDVGKRVLVYVEALDPKLTTADELARNARVLNQLGEVRLLQGNTPAALQMFRRAEKLTQQAVTREPRNGPALLVHGNTEFWIGNALWTQARYDEALPHMREYMKVGEALSALDRNNREYQLERAFGHAGVALVLEPKGDLAGALKHYRVSLDVKQELARREPDDANAQAEVARAYNKVGGVLYKMGDLYTAISYSRKEVEIYRSLLIREPKSARWKQRLAASMAYLGRSLNDTGETDKAFALWQDELQIEKELASLDPTNVDWQRNVAITLRWIAHAHEIRGDRAAALDYYEDAIAQIKEVARQAPARNSFAVDALNLESEEAHLRAENGDRRAAGRLAAIVRELQPMQSPYARYQLARTAFFLGEALRKSDPAKAMDAWKLAERELGPIVATSGDPTELALWTRILIRRGQFDAVRATLKRIQKTGYATSELERLCAENGC